MNNFFVNIGETTIENRPQTIPSFESFLPHGHTRFSFENITDTDVRAEISELKNLKCDDFSTVPNHIYKLIIENIVSPLKHMFNEYLDMLTFSESLKISRVIPIF